MTAVLVDLDEVSLPSLFSLPTMRFSLAFYPVCFARHHLESSQSVFFSLWIIQACLYYFCQLIFVYHVFINVQEIQEQYWRLFAWRSRSQHWRASVHLGIHWSFLSWKLRKLVIMCSADADTCTAKVSKENGTMPQTWCLSKYHSSGPASFFFLQGKIMGKLWN